MIMMIVAALLEAFPRQLVEGAINRYLIGAFFLALWVSYFFMFGAKERAGASPDATDTP